MKLYLKFETVRWTRVGGLIARNARYPKRSELLLQHVRDKLIWNDKRVFSITLSLVLKHFNLLIQQDVAVVLVNSILPEQTNRFTSVGMCCALSPQGHKRLSPNVWSCSVGVERGDAAALARSVQLKNDPRFPANPETNKSETRKRYSCRRGSGTCKQQALKYRIRFQVSSSNGRQPSTITFGLNRKMFQSCSATHT